MQLQAPLLASRHGVICIKARLTQHTLATCEPIARHVFTGRAVDAIAGELGRVGAVCDIRCSGGRRTNRQTAAATGPLSANKFTWYTILGLTSSHSSWSAQCARTLSRAAESDTQGIARPGPGPRCAFNNGANQTKHSAIPATHHVTLHAVLPGFGTALPVVLSVKARNSCCL
jgi:hypothetical protein